MKYIVSFLLILLLVCSCASIPDNLTIIPSDDIDVTVKRGAVIGETENNDLDLSLVGNNIDDGVGSFIFSLTNNGEKEYPFRATDISILGSDSKFGPWTLIERWDAKAFYDKAVKDYKSDVFWTSFAGALYTFNSVFGRHSETTIYTRGGAEIISTHTYDPTDVILSSYLAETTTNSVKKEGQAYISYLEKNLLFDSILAPDETYLGWVYFGLKRNQYKFLRVDFTNSISGNKSKFILEIEKR